METQAIKQGEPLHEETERFGLDLVARQLGQRPALLRKNLVKFDNLCTEPVLKAYRLAPDALRPDLVAIIRTAQTVRRFLDLHGVQERASRRLHVMANEALALLDEDAKGEPTPTAHVIRRLVAKLDLVDPACGADDVRKALTRLVRAGTLPQVEPAPRQSKLAKVTGRAGQLLDILRERGPQTTAELAEALGGVSVNVVPAIFGQAKSRGVVGYDGRKWSLGIQSVDGR